MDWYWRYGISYLIVAAGSVLFMMAPFNRRYRQASRWLRSVFFLFAAAGLGWSALGFYLLSHQHGQRSDLKWSQFWALDHLKSTLGGVALGLLVALLTNPELRRRVPRDTASV